MMTACQSNDSGTRIFIPSRTSTTLNTEEAPDDIVYTPGGSAYRANVFEQGVQNPWPPIEMTVVQIGSGSKTIDVRYRNHIVTKAGETRNNILYLNKEGGFDTTRIIDIKLYSTEQLSSLELFQEGGAGLIGQEVTVLVIEIPPDIKTGEYNFETGLEIEGRDYGTIPCLVEVVE